MNQDGKQSRFLTIDPTAASYFASCGLVSWTELTQEVHDQPVPSILTADQSGAKEQHDQQGQEEDKKQDVQVQENLPSVAGARAVAQGSSDADPSSKGGEEPSERPSKKPKVD